MMGKTGLHAIRALVQLSCLPTGEYRGAAQVAASIGAPANYLGKLLQVLLRHGVVESQKGPGGGFRLARAARAIRLIDVVEAIEPTACWPDCFLGRPRCSETTACAVHERWTAVKDGYRAMLSETTIADLTEASPTHPAVTRDAP
jgi:Rrf2 family protein